MKTRDVKETLAGSGIKVTSNLIYFIKGKMRGRLRGALPRASASSPVTDTVDMVRRVKGMAQDLGGIGKLKELVDTLAE